MVEINEKLARRAKENMSFSDYKPGTATAEYKEYCKEADEKAAKYPDNPKVQAAAERYKRDIGNWINKYNANGAGHVSVMIAGPANYNMRAHQKYVNRENTLLKEYEDIKNRFDTAIRGAAHQVIHDTDPDALEQLIAKLGEEVKAHSECVEYNRKARKEGKQPLAPYILQNSNGRIKALRDRIENLKKRQSQEPHKAEFEGGYVEENIQAGRTQIFYNEKPDEETRAKLKASGWRWAPSSGAWQRQISNNAWYSAKQILHIAQ